MASLKYRDEAEIVVFDIGDETLEGYKGYRDKTLEGAFAQMEIEKDIFLFPQRNPQKR